MANPRKMYYTPEMQSAYLGQVSRAAGQGFVARMEMIYIKMTQETNTDKETS